MRRLASRRRRSGHADLSSWRTPASTALPLFLVYVWVTLANGFRFGPRYLLISLGASLVAVSAWCWRRTSSGEHRIGDGRWA